MYIPHITIKLMIVIAKKIGKNPLSIFVCLSSETKSNGNFI